MLSLIGDLPILASGQIHSGLFLALLRAGALIGAARISILDGYCVQEDFDDIISRLDTIHRHGIIATFISAFLIKTIVKEFFDRPFWYFDLLPKGEGEAPWQGVSAYGDMLESVWSRFEEVSPWYSRIWCCLTTRLSTSMYRDQCIDLTFGKTMKARRHTGCKALASNILADETFQWMLKPTQATAQ
ncbi:hypothetical protein BJY00DRAFT_271584 [Aspergillus carlsbadensis]|nr:hypothetical protein BJY00DRAFT_271584 [Aspergillus carlsbadensis]